MPRVALAVWLLGLAAGFREERGPELPGRAPPEALGNDFNGALDDTPSSSAGMCGRTGTAVHHVPAALSNGLAFIRPPKVGSSTFGGVLLRVAHRFGLVNVLDCDRIGRKTSAVLVGTHLPRHYLAGRLAQGMPKARFVTLIRDPAARCLSAFYFRQVGRMHEEPTAANKIRHIEQQCGPRKQFDIAKPALNSSLQALLLSYDFVAVTERFDASLLILAKKLGVGLNDILYVPGKVSGSGVNHTTGRAIPEHPPFSQEPESVQEAAKRTFGGGLDEQLLAAANLALDREMASYGPGFHVDLAEYQRRLAVVAGACQSRYADALLDGVPSDAGCLYRDVGCGQPCIDETAAKHQWD